MDIEASKPHYHKETTEFYLVVQGRLEVTLGDQPHLLVEGEGIEIPIGVRHWARGLGGDRARIAAFTFPAWTIEDQHLVEESGRAEG